MTRENRQHQRFNVANLNDIKGQIRSFQDTEHLATFSEGGCGFYSLKDNDWLEEYKRLELKFELNGNIVYQAEVHGTIIYKHTYKVGEKTIRFYGIRFVPGTEEKIKPIVSRLALLREQGQVNEA